MRASRTLLLAAAAGFGAAQAFIPFYPTLAGVSAALFVTGVCYSIYTSSTNALVQLSTPGYMQGRVGGLYNYVFLATGPAGSLLAGYISERGGAPLAFAVGGAATLVMALAGFLLRPWPMPTGTVRPRAIQRPRESF